MRTESVLLLAAELASFCIQSSLLCVYLTATVGFGVTRFKTISFGVLVMIPLKHNLQAGAAGLQVGGVQCNS